jgi:C4-dicarboxylate-specific signal transduction histidine kinase
LNAEELQVKLKNAKDEQERMSILLRLGEKKWIATDYEQSRKYAKLVLRIAKSMQDEENLASAHYLLGLSCCYSNNYDEALKNYYISLKLYKKTNNNVSQAETYNSIGQIFILMEDYEKALECYQDAIELLPDYARTYNNMGLAYNYMGNYKKGEEFSKQAYELAVIQSKKKYKVRANKRSQVIALINLTTSLIKLEKYQQALTTAKKALSLSEEKEDTYLVTLNNMGSVYKNLAEYDVAFEFLQKAKELGRKHQNKEHLRDTYVQLTEVFERKGDYKNAYKYSCQQRELERKIYHNKMADKIAKLKTEHELERDELEAKQMAEKASKLASIGVMAAGITHEINQPLCAIKVTVDSLMYWNEENSLLLPKPFERGLDKISKASGRIDEIIKHMRSFLQFPEIQNLQELDVNKVIKRALSLLENQLHSHLIYLQLDLHSEPVIIESETVNLEQIIINIVVNAMHSLDECKHKEKRILIQTGIEDQKARIQIHDNGKGLKEEDIEKIFDPFYSTKKPGKGMGLGLAIVKNYVERYDGIIVAENNETGGASFKIEFPATKMEDKNEDTDN